MPDESIDVFRATREETLMQIPFETDVLTEPTKPIEPVVADQPPMASDHLMPSALPVDEEPATGGPVNPATSATPEKITPPVSSGDAGAAQRRITMQLYWRMVTDLKVLTGDKRVATDDEITEALNRAVR